MSDSGPTVFCPVRDGVSHTTTVVVPRVPRSRTSPWPHFECDASARRRWRSRREPRTPDAGETEKSGKKNTKNQAGNCGEGGGAGARGIWRSTERGRKRGGRLRPVSHDPLFLPRKRIGHELKTDTSRSRRAFRPTNTTKPLRWKGSTPVASNAF